MAGMNTMGKPDERILLLDRLVDFFRADRYVSQWQMSAKSTWNIEIKLVFHNRFFTVNDFADFRPDGPHQLLEAA